MAGTEWSRRCGRRPATGWHSLLSSYSHSKVLSHPTRWLAIVNEGTAERRSQAHRDEMGSDAQAERWRGGRSTMCQFCVALPGSESMHPELILRH